MEPKRLLFAVPALYGHLHLSMAIAQELAAHGHIVGYCTGSTARAITRKYGMQEFYPRDVYQKAFDVMALAPDIVSNWCVAAREFTVEVMVESFRELIRASEEFKPAVVYIDTTDFPAVAGAERFKVPYAHGSATAIFFFEKDIPPCRNRMGSEQGLAQSNSAYPLFGAGSPVHA